MKKLDIVIQDVLRSEKWIDISKPSAQRGRFCDLEALDSLIYKVKDWLGKDEIIMAEIGCFYGESSAVFAQNVKELQCIDPWDKEALLIEHEKKIWNDYFDIVENIFDDVNKLFPNIKKNKMKSSEAVSLFPDNYFDFIYIDAEHSYESIYNDINIWKNKTKKFIGGHDYFQAFPGVMRAVNELLGKPEIIFVDTSWLCEVNK